MYPKMGIAVIVNNVHSEKPGSQHDVKVLEQFYSMIGFKVHVYKDCTDKVNKFCSISFILACLIIDQGQT